MKLSNKRWNQGNLELLPFASMRKRVSHQMRVDTPAGQLFEQACLGDLPGWLPLGSVEKMSGQEARTLDSAARNGTISTDMVRILLGGAPLAHGKLVEILRLVGVEPALLERSQERISTRQLAIVWNEMERAADDPILGLHLSELRDGLPSGHVLFSAMLNSPTLGQALSRYCRFVISDAD
jgi:hypothetical protein